MYGSIPGIHRKGAADKPVVSFSKRLLERLISKTEENARAVRHVAAWLSLSSPLIYRRPPSLTLSDRAGLACFVFLFF